MKISAVDNNDELLIEDIYYGDVWVCSGQSNMELPMQRLKDNFPEEWESPINSLIRQFKVLQECEFSGPRQYFSGGSWAAASCETLYEFSGTAWFFAKEMYKKSGVPIGLINASWGGSPAEAWMSREALAAFPEKIALGDKYAAPGFCDETIRKSDAELKAWHDALAVDSGLAEAWYKPETKWGEAALSVTLPGRFSDAGLDRFSGVVWLYREFEVSGGFIAGAGARGSRLWLGTIVDADTVYINGVKVGNTEYRYPPRKYSVPAGLLHAGKNQIVIRVTCCNGEGEITEGKDFRIFSGIDSIDLKGTWKYRVGIRTAPCPEAFFCRSQPMGLYNAMIAPMVNYPCTGILWYQGESNTGKPGEYLELFTSLIKDWRMKWRNHDLPFLFVQLPVFGEPEENNEENSWAIVREAQCSALSLPATGMAAGLELGEWNDLHPVNKKDVGRRLALAAERVVFKSQNTSPGPLCRNVHLHQGRLIVAFDNCGTGLTAREKPYVSVIAGGSFFRLPADIESPDSLSVDISSVQNPEKLLYAWAGNPRDRQLYNADGLPVIPFRVNIKE